MNVFWIYIQEKIKNTFDIDVNVFVSKSKKLGHFSFEKPLVPYSFFHSVIELVTLRWDERKVFFW